MARAFTRLLLQFRQSPILIDILNALSSEIQVLSDVTMDVIRKRGPADAQGANLDAIGRIVGQIRTLEDFNFLSWFTPDENNQGWNSAPVWVKNAPQAGDYIADDTWFRQLIQSKVTRNFVKYASIPELIDFVYQAFGIQCGFVRIDTMTINVVVPIGTSLNIKHMLSNYGDVANAERVYFVPVAAGVQISDVVELSEVDSILLDENGDAILDENGNAIL